MADGQVNSADCWWTVYTWRCRSRTQRSEIVTKRYRWTQIQLSHTSGEARLTGWNCHIETMLHKSFPTATKEVSMQVGK